jgi:hypothetical protein
MGEKPKPIESWIFLIDRVKTAIAKAHKFSRVWVWVYSFSLSIM